MNFGWPCREGPEESATYEALAPAHHGCASIGTVDNPSLPSAPALTWHHADSTLSIPYGLVGNCASGTAFYTGTNYPAQYRGRLFFSDYGAGWMRVATLDTAQRLVALQDFASGLDGPVDLAPDPLSHDLVYVSIYAGQVRRIRYVGGGIGGLPPVAHASASDIARVAPAEVRFSSIGSFDPGGAPIHFAWSFGDGTTGSSEESPSHPYTDAGERNAILTVSRDDGALARDTVRVVLLSHAGYPATAVLDSFSRADGAVTPPWVGSVSGLAVRDSAMVQTGPNNYATWNGGVFGANQEVFVRFDGVTPASAEHDLTLKIQGTSWTSGCIQVGWSPVNRSMALNTYLPGIGFVHRGGPWRDVSFAADDTWGARALSNGVVEIFKNGEVIANASVGGWPFARSGGRVGIMLQGGSTTRITEFGGGNLSIVSNQPPQASILEPRDGAFYVEQQPVNVLGTGDDPEDPPSALRYHWDVTLHHNNHIHPGIFTVDSVAGSFVPENHEDGTGVWLAIRLSVTDRGGLTADTTVTLWPETDLTPSPITTTPAMPTGFGTTEYRFALANLGRMPSRFSRWTLIADGIAIAQGDTLVPALDSVIVSRVLPALPVAPHTLRVVADTLGVVVETDETNNGRTQRWAPIGFPTARVLDTFERADAALSAPWVGSLSGLTVHTRALEQTRPTSYAIWNRDPFGPDQEVFVRFERVTANAPEHDLLLKVQGNTWTKGCIQVLYSARENRVSLYTYAPDQGWVRRGGPWMQMRLAAGDQFGARAFASGVVVIYRNGVAIASGSVGAWAFASQGGRVGMILNGATSTRWIDFGGGDVGASGDTPPRARVLTPIEPAFCAPRDTLRFRATADDDEESADSLRYRWVLTGLDTTIARLGATDSEILPAETPAIPIPVRCIVTDACGLVDTAEVVLRPEVDLQPTEIVTTPPASMGDGVTRFDVTIRNLGRANAASSHWVLLADGAPLDEGDVAIPARGSAVIRRVLPSLAFGAHALRLVADSLGAVIETREDNNALDWMWTELPFPNAAALDEFDRADAPLTSPWAGSLSRYAVRDSALVLTGSTGYAIWNGGSFDDDQEAWARFDSLTAAAPEHDLLLKVQGTTWTAGAIQVIYSAPQALVVVNTYDTISGWVRRGGPWRNVILQPGDLFGARALADGRVRVYVNGVAIGQCDVTPWPFATGGGRIGLLMTGATDTRIAAFGGGGFAAALDSHAALPESEPEVKPTIAARLSLSPVRPNPVSGVASLDLELPAAAGVCIEVFDINGRLIWSSPSRELPPGRTTLRWPATNVEERPVPAGVYVARVSVGHDSFSRRLVVLK
jgi:PKD repeat protein